MHPSPTVAGALPDVAYSITYGKAEVPVYRQYATALAGLPEVPESSFRGRDNALFANEVTVEVFGDNFLPAYTEGDNSNVVATDSMKNFILGQAAEFDGATLEQYLAELGEAFLAKYPQMQGVEMSGRELPFSAQSVPSASGFVPSGELRQRQWSDLGTAEIRFERRQDGCSIAAHRSGRVGLELLKTKGSAFTSFVRDEYTTLPERIDRPLFVRLDVHWRYADPADAVGSSCNRYVAGEQVRDVCAVVFDEVVSESIQELVHEIGKRLLERYPQLQGVEFLAKNMTRDPFPGGKSIDGQQRVYVPPFPAFGTITLAMNRER
jgi:urate oxidase / 2-oxo-4-hydroxy-4-carboxy-5-ureidoimidazoline decarboxylase